MRQIIQVNINDIIQKEFLLASVDRKKMLETKNLDLIFNLIDTDRSGFITLKELNNRFGGQITEKQYQKLMEDLDKNGNGKVQKKPNNFFKITKKEFKNAMAKLIL